MSLHELIATRDVEGRFIFGNVDRPSFFPKIPGSFYMAGGYVCR